MNFNKILIVTTEFPPQPGGIGNHALNLAEQMTLHGKEVIVLTNSRSKDGRIEHDFDQELEFKIIRVVRKNPTIFTYLNRWRAYRKIVILEKPDIILASGKFSLWLVGISFFNKNLKKAAVIHGSEVNLTSKLEQFLVNWSLKQMHKLIAVSNYTKKIIAPLKTPIHVISNGFNPTEFSLKGDNQSLKSNELNLITVGALTQRKGQHNVIRALPILRSKFPNLHYHMVGIPTEKNRIDSLAKDLHVEDLITIHGELKQEELVQLLGNCDIFVMLSEVSSKGQVEGFGIALLEANYLGIPTIGSLNCGIEDAIDNYKSGILVPLNDNKAFEQAIEAILSDTNRYKEEAKQWAFKHQWDVIISKYLKVLES